MKEANNIPQGYKNSPLGIIPKEWEVKRLGDCTSLLTNGFVGVATPNYTENTDGITYIQGFNVTEGGFNLKGIKKVTVEFHRKNIKSSLKEGDLLTIQTGDIGLTTIVPKQLEGSNCHALIITRFNQYVKLLLMSFIIATSARPLLNALVQSKIKALFFCLGHETTHSQDFRLAFFKGRLRRLFFL